MKTSKLNCTESLEIDCIFLEKCLWIFNLEPCTIAFYVWLLVRYVLLFFLIVLLSRQCSKNLLASHLRKREVVSVPSPEESITEEGGQETPTNQERQQDSLNSQRPSGNVQLSSPAYVRQLLENFLFACIAVLALIAISNTNAELYKIATALSALQVFIIAVTTVAAVIRLNDLRTGIFTLLCVGIDFYGILLIWSFSRHLDSLEKTS